MSARLLLSVLALVVVTAASTVEAREFSIYPEDATSYTVLSGQRIYFRFGVDAWAPNWRGFRLRGEEQTVGGRRLVAGDTPVPGAATSIAMQHEMRRADERTVEVVYELTADRDVELTQIVLRLDALRTFFAGTQCVVGHADGTRTEAPIPLGRGSIGSSVDNLTFTDHAGRQVHVSISPAREVAMDGVGRVVLTGSSLQAGIPRKTTFAFTFTEPVEPILTIAAAGRSDDTSDWFPYEVGPKGVPIDLSFLNKDADGNYIPAGAHGFVTVRDGHFVFEDGTPVRFWGTNLTAWAVLTEDPHRAGQLAERLARLGVNVVRLHHLDSWANPIIDYNHPDGTTQHLNPRGMRALDRTIYELKKRGIYVMLDPWVQRHFTEADGVVEYNWTGPKNFNLHPYIYFDQRMQELIRKQWQQVWTHVNEFTGVAYKDEPAIANTEIINEGLLVSFASVQEEHYINVLRKRYEDWAWKTNGLPWEEANVLTQNHGENNIRFMMHLHERFYRESQAFLRGMGVRVPITFNNWARWTWEVVPQAGADFMDMHLYYGGDQLGPGSGLGGSWIEHPPHVPGGPFGKIGGVALAGKAVASSELGNNPPKYHRAPYLLGLAAVSALQGWDCLNAYAFSQSASPARTLGAFEHESDPLSIGGMAAGALIYRRGDVAPARETVVLHIPEEEVFHLRFADGFAMQYWNTAGFCADLERHRVMVLLPGFEPPAGAPIKREWDVESSYAYRPASSELRSDTGELYRDWKKGVGSINTPRSQAAYGRLGELAQPMQTSDCTFEIQTPFAAVSLHSLTDDPIAESASLLLVAMARCQNTGMVYNPPMTRFLDGGGPPVICEPVTGRVSFAARGRVVNAYPVRADGSRGPAIRLVSRDGRFHLDLKSEHQTIFYAIEAAR